MLERISANHKLFETTMLSHSVLSDRIVIFVRYWFYKIKVKIIISDSEFRKTGQIP